ncbi:hypothetical protein SEA_SMEADLEY_52 [Mycobacterium phage Smeadley]|uniref:Uncharacterized protein n=1 Tax=Mycobacterium phage Smeadley TaxID=1673873 RepID=A0A0H4TGV4_9CAUD|nr:hypothetical protein AVT31_gp055 [Mycobacterium phage Smeadley]AKQ07620.1 hypothetical protein SEA_SMEADLEY_52 [Mycobacterium phage Smeadley]
MGLMDDYEGYDTSNGMDMIEHMAQWGLEGKGE